MNSKDYQAAALRTESVPARLEINELSAHAMLTIMIAASKLGDLLKRKLYYGKDIPQDELQDGLLTLGNMSGYLLAQAGHEPGVINERMSGAARDEFAELPDEIKGMNLDNLNVRLLHAGLGVFTESGEMLKALLLQYETGKLDKVNFGEELGDVDWYKAVAHDETGVSEEDTRAKNIAKLKQRFADKFTADAALNRDLAAERAALEQPTAAR